MTFTSQCNYNSDHGRLLQLLVDIRGALLSLSGYIKPVAVADQQTVHDITTGYDFTEWGK